MDCWIGRKFIDIKSWLFILLLLIIPIVTPAHAELNMNISIGYSGIRILDPGFDYISQNNYLDEFNLGAGYRFYDNLSAFVNYIYAYEKSAETIKSILMTHGALLGVRYTLSYVRWIQPYIDAGFIYYWGRLALSDEYSELKKRDWTLGFAGDIGVLIFPFKKYNLFFKTSIGYILNPHFDNLTLNFDGFGVLEMEGRRYTVSAGIFF